MRISDWSSDVCSSDLKLTLRDNIRFGADYGAFAACRLLAGASASPSPLLSAGLLDPDAAGCMNAPARAAVTAQLGPLAPLLVPSLDTLYTIRNAGDVDSRRSEERRVGKEGVSTGRARSSQLPEKQKISIQSRSSTRMLDMTEVQTRPTKAHT